MPTRWYPDSKLKLAALTQVLIRESLETYGAMEHTYFKACPRPLPLMVASSDTPGDVLNNLRQHFNATVENANCPPLGDMYCLIYRQRVLASHLSLAQQDVQHCAVLVLSKRECCATGLLVRKDCDRCMRACIRSRCGECLLSKQNLARNGMYLRLIVFSLALICYVMLTSLLFYYLEHGQQKDWHLSTSWYFTWVMITTRHGVGEGVG